MAKAQASDAVAVSRSESPTVIIELTKRNLMKVLFNPGILVVRVGILFC